MTEKEDLEKLFALHPVRPGKISEISEATAGSPVSPAERVNFHIGNPVQDERLTLDYLRSVLNLNSNSVYDYFDAGAVRKELGRDAEEEKRILFLYNIIKNSNPYSPRGGFNIKNPSPIVKKFHKWLTEEQDEPLSYDLGEKTGRREIIISSGGIPETLRVLLHTFNSYLVNLPAEIFLLNFDLAGFCENYKNLNFIKLSSTSTDLFYQLQNYLKRNSSKPAYLVLGEILNEEMRRNLRNLSLNFPLSFIEVNDALNHFSLAREAKLKNRVIRILTPRFLSQRLKDLSTVFLTGPASLLSIFESVHFQLKGTPSASEIGLLQYLSENPDEIGNFKKINELPEQQFPVSGHNPGVIGGLSVLQKTYQEISELINRKQEKVSAAAARISSGIKEREYSIVPAPDYLMNKDAFTILEEFFANIDNPEWISEAVKSFKAVFAKVHPYYNVRNLAVVSGSSRTALGLLGFHCGISEAITCDLSWNYEHCFPKVHVISLTDDFELDSGAIRSIINRKTASRQDSGRLAVVLNNPHNASGKIFRESDIKEILIDTLGKNIFIIDDLAYQNVLPEKNLNGPKTVKQLALDLVKEGKLYKEALDKIITIHSLSKTDCYAGARLAAAEINDQELFKRFSELNGQIRPNINAVLIAYLFYRNDHEQISRFWFLRNCIFNAKMNAVTEAAGELPSERNLFNIHIERPEGSMYPRMVIEKLPNGLSLDWLSSGLAAQGIGLVPLSSFARTSKGYDLGRKSFRLTLGGADTPDILLRKTRRVLIDLNRLIAEEEAKYNKQSLAILSKPEKSTHYFDSPLSVWSEFIDEVEKGCRRHIRTVMKNFSDEGEILSDRFHEKFLPGRIDTFTRRFKDNLDISRSYLSLIASEGNKFLEKQLEFEFYKDDLERRRHTFRRRTFDRTVHPTQMYAIDSDILFNSAIDKILRNRKPSKDLINKISICLIDEYCGRNVAIVSVKEGEELVCDLRSMISAEHYTSLYSSEQEISLLSFWGDWDGSNRPSGQGHRLVASVLLENVMQLSNIINTLIASDNILKIDPELLNEISQISLSSRNFWQLLNDITSLTNQLEKRYRSILPFSIESNRFKKSAVKMHLVQDPVIKLWQHNDRLEQKMMELRSKRKERLEYYFMLNKRLRKTLYDLIPFILKNSSNTRLMLQVSLYRDLLKRFVLTPRIHQKLITQRDQFAINTTAYNITEINALSGSYGNPGMVLGLQVSMTTNPEALISLDKKLSAEREKMLKNIPAENLPKVWSIPLFEDLAAVANINLYLDKIWDYAVQSRSIDQEIKKRFSEIICEIFIAGSDLSQQTGQTASSLLYNAAKHKTMEWLAKKGLIEEVRMKLGSGEPMQRQGGYYAEFSSMPAFNTDKESVQRLSAHLKESTVKSTEFAVSPLHGVFAGGDLRTLQSGISEQMRYLGNKERALLLHHLYKTQRYYHNELIRAAEPFIDTRLIYESKSLQELERLTLGKTDEIFNEFAELTRDNFRQIIYGTDEDVVGIHIISYFLSRAMPNLRDRPVERSTEQGSDNKGQRILERIASIIPLSKHGSLLRAISHNKAQTFVLGINQLTTGLFRALKQFSQKDFIAGSGYQLLNDRILPRLPVYEILLTLRLFQDYRLKNIQKFSDSFPAGISAFALLREDMDSLEFFIPLLQKELLRRHGINVAEFFTQREESSRGSTFIADLLPTVRPDLAVLLQEDLFNTQPELVLKEISYIVPENWFKAFSNHLIIPEKISHWREKIWGLLEEPVKSQVKSFVELSVALSSLSRDISTKELNLTSSFKKSRKPESSVADLLRGKVDDSMRQFLSAAVQYLTTLPREMIEVPVDIIRALKEVERILRIEEEALSKTNQELLQFYLLQIARHVGDNG